MKRKILTIAMIFGLISISAQNYSSAKKTKFKKEDLSITVNETEKNKIDWKSVKEYFSDKKENDSIQLSVKITPQKEQKIRVAKKYSVIGIKRNIEELISSLRKMVEK